MGDLIERLGKLSKCYALHSDEQDTVKEAIEALTPDPPEEQRAQMRTGDMK